MLQTYRYVRAAEAAGNSVEGGIHSLALHGHVANISSETLVHSGDMAEIPAAEGRCALVQA